ncbi:MAG: YCF48-related protein [Parcubacteria group bacterium]|jgi:photosystem II stability/assembly factor-like uncharacterized protein
MKTKRIIIFLAGVLFLAGCTLTGGGSDGGFYRSDDGGKTFLPKNNISQNGKAGTIGGVDVLSLAPNPQSGGEIYIGTKTSGIFKTTDAGDNWRLLSVATLTPNKVYAMAIDPVNPNNVYAATLVGKRGKIIKSENAGENWKEVYTEPSDGSIVLSIALDPANSQNIYAGTDQGQIIFSESGGESWRSLYWTSEKDAVYKIAIDKSNSQLLYFAIFKKGIIRSKDGGKNFEELGQNNSFEKDSDLQNPTAIIADPNRPGWVYAGTGKGLIRSKDGGDSWEAVSILNKAEEQSIWSIDINTQNSDEIIYSVSKAFYKSNDGGVNWMTVQFDSSRSPNMVSYNPQKPEMIYIGMSKK